MVTMMSAFVGCSSSMIWYWARASGSFLLLINRRA